MLDDRTSATHYEIGFAIAMLIVSQVSSTERVD